MIIFLIILAAIVLGIYFFMRSAPFGAIPAGERLNRIQLSPNYREKQFQNLNHTPQLAEGASFAKVTREFFFGKKERNKPARPLPSNKTDLMALQPDENVLVWMGHSSYYMQIDGKKMLVDPVFSGAASPISFTTRSFPGADIYTTDEIPALDFLFLTHDHWDHLDYDTVKKLQHKTNLIITGLGTAQHLQRWGFDMAKVIEKDWDQPADLGDGFSVTALPARHFSGRTFKRNTSLWASFALRTPQHHIYIGGDSGYDTHFKTIGNTHGPFDLAILECGQYNAYWKYIHMMPEETVQAAIDLDAKQLMPVHWAKFALSLHAWDEPINRVYKAARDNNMPLHTPMIGGKMYIDAPQPSYTKWWEGLE
ncbi:MAG: MBL fold metallo-hydrolase [Bacteroidetes bacterium]|nr:MBL fold metallo-hydrolase [Bacteroidota bacterium]